MPILFRSPPALLGVNLAGSTIYLNHGGSWNSTAGVKLLRADIDPADIRYETVGFRVFRSLRKKVELSRPFRIWGSEVLARTGQG